jgi:hypothetical protein
LGPSPPALPFFGQVGFEVDPFQVNDVLILNERGRPTWVASEVHWAAEGCRPQVIIPESPNFLLAAGMLGFLQRALPDEVAAHERPGPLRLTSDGEGRVTIPDLDETAARAVFTVFGSFAQAVLVTFAGRALSIEEIRLAIESGVHLAHTEVSPISAIASG